MGGWVGGWVSEFNLLIHMYICTYAVFACECARLFACTSGEY